MLNNCWRKVACGESSGQSELKSHEDNVGKRSSIRRTSSDRRKSLNRISWNNHLETVIIIPARTQEFNHFMDLVQTPPLLRPRSPSPFDVTVTAAGAAHASRVGVKLAMENSFKYRNRRAAHERQAYDDGNYPRYSQETVFFEDDACSWLSALSAPSAKSDKPKHHTVMNLKWVCGRKSDSAVLNELATISRERVGLGVTPSLELSGL